MQAKPLPQVPPKCRAQISEITIHGLGRGTRGSRGTRPQHLRQSGQLFRISKEGSEVLGQVALLLQLLQQRRLVGKNARSGSANSGYRRSNSA
jgi:hypothetical protein